MATPWPGTLPEKPVRDGYSETFANLIIRSSMDVGPDKIRKRYTAGIKPISEKMVLSSAQVVIFEAFYYEDLAGGVFPFTRENPRTLQAVDYRFTDQPKIIPIGGLTEEHWEVTYNLEQMQ